MFSYDCAAGPSLTASFTEHLLEIISWSRKILLTKPQITVLF